MSVLLRAAVSACEGDEGNHSCFFTKTCYTDACPAEKARLCLERMAIWECYECDDLLIALHSLSAFTIANPLVRVSPIPLQYARSTYIDSQHVGSRS